MKFVTCELQKIALAALVLGVFSLSPLAKAEDPAPAAAPAADEGLDAASANWDGGMGLGDLKTLSNGTFNVRLVGETMYMDGSIPRKCARGASLSTNSVAADASVSQAAQHQIKFVPGPDCAKLTATDKQDRVKLSSAALFGPSRALPDNSVDGPVCVLHSADGPNACDNVGKLTFTSADTLKAKALADATAKQTDLDKKARETAAQERDRKQKELIAKLQVLCKNGDYAGFGAEIEAAKSFLGDVTQILQKVEGAKPAWLISQIKNAKNLDTLKDAYQNFLDASADSDSADDAANAYADKRITFLQGDIANAKMSAADKAGSIRDVASDLRDLNLMDSKIGSRSQTGQELMRLAFEALGSKVADDAGTDLSKLREAEGYYRESEDYGDNATKAKAEAAIAKMYNVAADQCLSDAKEKGKGFQSCDALAKKAKGAMDAAIKAQGKIKGDDSLEALAGMKQEKIARFGIDGYSMNVSGYGSMNRMGGSYDQSKYSAYTQSQQQFLMQMYMKQSMGQYGQQPGMTGTGTGTGGSYFSN